MTPTHKIVSLQASNVKVLKAISITPQGNTVVLTGANEAGKSSILDCIQMVMGGADAIPPRPIRDGTSKASIVLDLGDLVATRTFGPTGTAIKVTNREGAVQKSPQGILDSLVGKLSFDPLEFSRQKPEVQLVTLRRLVGLDTSKLDAERAAVFGERTIVNREHDSAKARLALFPHDPAAPAQAVDVSELIQKLTLAQQQNESNAEQRRAVDRLRELLGTAKTEEQTAQQGVESAKAEVTRLEQELQAAKAAVTSAEGVLAAKRLAITAGEEKIKIADAALAEVVDVDTQAITDAINSAAAVNAKVQANKSHNDQKEIVTAKATKSAELTAKLEQIDGQKAKLLADCKFPLEGLSIDGDEILFNRIPFSQASTAKKLLVSVSIGIALNPNLRVMFIRDGSLLDQNGLEIVAKMAAEKDVQIWIEDARSTDPMALLIQDGEIVPKT